jgi:hypothetical protein
MFRRFQTAIFRPSILQYSSNRRPEDGGLETPKHVASLIDVNNKEVELC